MSSATPLDPAFALPADECRCLCGNLLARLVEGGVELKCRRCKRTVVVPVEPQAADRFPLTPRPAVPNPEPSPAARSDARSGGWTRWRSGRDG
jgi:hypothetical protein